MIKNDLGAIHMADQVIAVLAREAAFTVEEVIDVDGHYLPVLSTVMQEEEKGVHVSVKNNMVAIDLYICVAHGLRIPAIALKLQKVVKEKIQEALHIVVSEVNVNVQHIVFHKNRESYAR